MFVSLQKVIIIFCSGVLLSCYGEDDDLKYVLFTKRAPNGEDLTPENIENTTFNSYNEIKFVIPGFTANITNDDMITLRNALLTTEDRNVIMVDWTKYSDGTNYAVAALENTKIAGEIFGRFLINIYEKLNLNLNLFHIISHSMGAPMAGFAAREVTNHTNKYIDRITGLDAAKPFFELPQLVPTLSKRDAIFVDAIHSEKVVKGCAEPYAHIDFYPNNGGPFQPGCGVDRGSNSCSHHRAVYYFAESIKNNKFVSHQCDSWNNYLNGKCNNTQTANMGFFAPRNVGGVFYLQTNGQYPFAKG